MKRQTLTPAAAKVLAALSARQQAFVIQVAHAIANNPAIPLEHLFTPTQLRAHKAVKREIANELDAIGEGRQREGAY